MLFQQDIDELLQKAGLFLDSSDSQKLQTEISDLENKLTEPDIWQNPNQAASLQKKLSTAQKMLNKYQELKNLCEELKIAGEINEENLAQEAYDKARDYLNKLENFQYLSGKFDDKDAILTIHSGAGGVDAEDWAAILASMYQSFCKNMNWKCTLIELSSGSEGGVKTAAMRVEGEYVYGLLKEEFGVHRLVRLSPFNAGHTRETSFALVEVMPLGIDEGNSLKIDEKDLKWDYFMSSGKGGQSVNTTYSAVRVTHLPTKISVSCQNERSQVQNKQMALKYLESKLAVIEAAKQAEMRQELRGDWQSAEWGNQIRNYVMHPYKLIKDVRSGWETSNIEEIIEKGELLPIIWSIKRAQKEE